jgi:hypothetical protein
MSRPPSPSSEKLILYILLSFVIMIAVGLQKPYAKLESGAILYLYEVYWLVKYLEYISRSGGSSRVVVAQGSSGDSWGVVVTLGE